MFGTFNITNTGKMYMDEYGNIISPDPEYNGDWIICDIHGKVIDNDQEFNALVDRNSLNIL